MALAMSWENLVTLPGLAMEIDNLSEVFVDTLEAGKRAGPLALARVNL